MRYDVVEQAVKFAAPKDSKERRILLETIRNYYDNPRSADAKGCLYESPDGSTCAVGRCMLVRERRSLSTFDNSSSVMSLIQNLPGEDIDPLLKTRYRGLRKGFWQGLQALHDSDRAWNYRGARGMTDDGARLAINFARDLCPGSNGYHYNAACAYLGLEA